MKSLVKNVVVATALAVTAVLLFTPSAKAQVFYASTGSNRTIEKLTNAGASPNGADWDISLFAALPDAYSAFDLDFDVAGNVYVTTTTSSADYPIRKYSSAGVWDDAFAVSGGVFLSARGLVSVDGSLYTADFSNQRINQINPADGVSSVFGISPTTRLTYIAYTAVPEPSLMALLVVAGGMVMDSQPVETGVRWPDRHLGETPHTTHPQRTLLFIVSRFQPSCEIVS